MYSKKFRGNFYDVSVSLKKVALPGLMQKSKLPPCGSNILTGTEKHSRIRQVRFNILDFGGADFHRSGRF